LAIDLIQPYAFTLFLTSMQGANVTLMRFATRLMTLPIRLFGVPIGQAAFPFLSQQSSLEERKTFNSLLIQSVNQVLFFTLPASILLLVLRVPIVRLVYGASSVPWADTLLLARLVGVLAVSVAAQAVRHILVRASYALENTRGPLLISVAIMLVTFAGGWYVTEYTSLQMLGLALVLSLAGILETILLYIYVYRLTLFSLIDSLWTMTKMTWCSVVMAYSLYVPMRELDITIIDTSRTVGVIILTAIVSAIGFAVYLFLCWLFKVKELQMVVKAWKRFDDWRKNISKVREVIESTSVEAE
jgi:putative peptidoglycan lipid II flippase